MLNLAIAVFLIHTNPDYYPFCLVDALYARIHIWIKIEGRGGIKKNPPLKKAYATSMYFSSSGPLDGLA